MKHYIALSALSALLAVSAQQSPTYASTLTYRLTSNGCNTASQGSSTVTGIADLGNGQTGCFCQGYLPQGASNFSPCMGGASSSSQALCVMVQQFNQDGSVAAANAQCSTTDSSQTTNTYYVVQTQSQCPSGQQLYAVQDTSGAGGCQCQQPAPDSGTECSSSTAQAFCTQSGTLTETTTPNTISGTSEPTGTCSSTCRADYLPSPFTLDDGETVCCESGATANSEGLCLSMNGSGIAERRRKARREQARLMRLEASPQCPSWQRACPVPSGGHECLDLNELTSCGGCATLGTGEDCTARRGVDGVGCIESGCIVLSCAEGYKLLDGECLDI